VVKEKLVERRNAKREEKHVEKRKQEKRKKTRRKKTRRNGINHNSLIYHVSQTPFDLILFQYRLTIGIIILLFRKY
tara:strand:+ start:408 stop:635 length:228 start_codon:yes stop_codon:yes gene_type:complete